MALLMLFAHRRADRSRVSGARVETSTTSTKPWDRPVPTSVLVAVAFVFQAPAAEFAERS